MTGHGGNRRQAPRLFQIEEHGVASARVRPGHEVALIDISAGGALVESRHRLLPGSTVDLCLTTAHRRTAVRGRILRCAVSRLHAACVWYLGAIGFEQQLSWFVGNESGGYLVHTADAGAERTGRADATHRLP